MSQASSAPVSTLKSPVLQDNQRQDAKSPSEDGLIIGITCGVLGFLAILIIFLVVGIRFRKKKKTRDDSDPTSCSNAQLLADGDSQINILQKYASPLDAKKSTSCPDIYQVNKSILLKIGPTAHAYEQLEQTSMAGSIRYKSEDRIAANLANITSYSSSLSKLGNDGRDGKIFDDDDDHIYHLPSVSNTFRRKSDGRIQTKKHDSDLFLISHGSKIPLYIEQDGSVEQIDCEQESGYQSPATSSPLTSPGAFDTSPTAGGDTQLNFLGYQTPTSGSPRVMPKNKHSEMIATGYRTPTSNSPKLFPKNVNVTPSQIRNEVLEHDNIYDVPKVDETDSIYSNIPARTSIINDDSGCCNDRQISLEERYKSPLKVVQPNGQRSYSIGSTKEKLQRRADNRQYEIPPNFSNSQPSLLKRNSEMKDVEVYPGPNINSQFDTSTGDMIYDVPARSHSIDRSVLSRSTEYDKDTLLNRTWSDKDKHSINTETLKSNYIDLDKLLSEKRNSADLNIKQYVLNEDRYIDRENETDTIYDVPSRCHTIDRTSNSPMKDHIVTSQNHNINSNIERTEHDYIDPDRLHKKNNLHIDNFNRRGSDESKKTSREKTYDVPNSRLDRTPSSEDGATYLNITPSTLEKRRSDVLMRKMGYDVPSTTPVFDPSQPSLLKLASQHLYKNLDTSPHHQNKFTTGKTSHDKPVHIPEYDPSDAYTTRPMNKKISSNQDNRSRHFTEGESIYDVPSNNKLATAPSVPDRVSSERNEETRDGIDECDNDAIYQNVFHLENGQPCLRTCKSSGQVC